MVVRGTGARKAKVFLCREDVRVEGAGKASRLHALYDWGATVTLVTHAAAVKAGLERKRQVPAAIAGLGGRCTMADSYYMVPVPRMSALFFHRLPIYERATDHKYTK